MTRLPVVRRREQSGFALLVIFLIAAAVAFTMYRELPRAAFESTRDKEQLLMDRGNQYKRAIQVFYAVNKRYPTDIKDLENTNEKRFLRHRYVDPMTGTDEWRLVHTNGSYLTDSLVTKPPTQNARNGLPGAGQTPGGGPLGANNMNTAPAANPAVNPALNSNDPNAVAAPAPLNAAAQRRPSDRNGSGFPLPPGNLTPGTGANPANYNPNDPSTWPPITLAPATTAQAGQAQPGSTPRTGQNNLGQFPGLGGANPSTQNSLVAAQVGDLSAQANAAQALAAQNTILPAVNAVPNSTDGQATAPAQPASNANSAFNQIPPGDPSTNLALAGFDPQKPSPPQPAVTSPQPNLGVPGTGGTASSNPLTGIGNALFRPNEAATTGPTGSAGIAGVASTFKGPSIKAYKERTKYQEWEFVYEPAVNQPSAAGQSAANPLGTNSLGANPLGAPAGQAGAQGQNSTGANSGASVSGQGSGQSPNNPFSQTNIFGPQVPAQ
ncbi:MAG: hypothetical protein M3O20_10420 [Acidobacteriota bacterium]|nr:hypothetical protein [Acidobacteriota bacterium]